MQELPSNWEWFLRAVLPALQLPMTIIGTALGAGIGGWVAFKTTTRAHEAAVKREMLARTEARRGAAVDRMRESADRYIHLLWQMYGFQTDLATSLSHWADGDQAMTDAELARMQPPSTWSAELMMLEQLHLPCMQGEAFAYGDLMTLFAAHLAEIVHTVRNGQWSSNQHSALREACWPLAQQMHRKIHALSTRLRSEIQTAEGPL